MKKKWWERVYIRALEREAGNLELYRIPFLQKQQEKLIAKIYREANQARKLMGEKPKRYKTWKKRKLVDVKG